jgi:hypothetical protein
MSKIILSDNGCGEAVTTGSYYGFRDPRNDWEVLATRGTSSGWKWVDAKGHPMTAEAVTSLLARVTEKRIVCG